MDKEKILNIIDQMSKNKPYFSKNEDYKNSFIEKLENVQLKDNNIYEKVRNLLIGENTKEKCKFSYYQGISELAWWFYLSDKGMDFEIDKSNKGKNNPDVDVSFTFNDVTYNIEIKCPEFNNYDENTLLGGLSYRQPDNDQRKNVKKIKSTIESVIEKEGLNKKVEIKKINDNKLKDYLLSAQNKFKDNNSKNCNILFLSLSNAELVDYILYLTNGCSGFLTKNSYVPHEEFNKVQAVIISNFLTINDGIIDYWDLSKCTNIVFLNEFSDYTDSNNIEKFLNLFANKTSEYGNKFKQILDTKQSNNIEIFGEDVVTEAVNLLLKK